MRVKFCLLVAAGDGKIVILGAGCHVIVIQNFRKQGATLFFDFSRMRISLGFINLLIYWVWFYIMYSYRFSDK